METWSENALQQVAHYRLLSYWHLDISGKVSLTESSGFAIFINIIKGSNI